jgi:integrase
LPGYWRDLRRRKTQPYRGPNPIQARWRHPKDPRITREKSCPNVRAAKDWIAEQETDANRGVWVDPHEGRETIAAIAVEWQKANRRPGPKTRVGYASILNAHIAPEFGSRRVASIGAADIDKWIDGLSNSGRAPKTIHNVVAVMHALLDFAVVRKYIPVNPCISVQRPSKRPQRKVKPVPSDDLAKLADAMPDDQSRAAVLVAGLCGLRAGEVWALKKEDVGIRRLRVDESLTEAELADRDPDYTRLPNGVAIGPTKTYNDEPVALPDVVAEALAAIIDPDAPADSFIFRDSNGGPMRQGNWYKRVFTPAARATFPDRTREAEQRAIAKTKAAGKPDLTKRQLQSICPVRFHDLRHTCASYMIEHGLHPKVIQQQMRHDDIRTTMNVYGHLFPDGLDTVADALDAGWRAAQAQNDAARSSAQVRELRS